MARQSKPQEEETPQSAPEWMVTFSDCMTLLLTFFVLLLSFSSFDNKKFSKLQAIYCTALDSIFPLRHDSRDSLNYIEPVKYLSEENVGSEKPTQSESKDEGLLKEKLSGDLNDGVVLLLPSEKIFLGNGKILSPQGRNILNDIALYLSEMPNRIVISEKSSIDNETAESNHLERAWIVMNYLVTKTNRKIDENRISVSISGTTSYQGSQKSDSEEKFVEISLLQRSIYN